MNVLFVSVVALAVHLSHLDQIHKTEFKSSKYEEFLPQVFSLKRSVSLQHAAEEAWFWQKPTMKLFIWRKKNNLCSEVSSEVMNKSLVIASTAEPSCFTPGFIFQSCLNHRGWAKTTTTAIYVLLSKINSLLTEIKSLLMHTYQLNDKATLCVQFFSPWLYSFSIFLWTD